MSMISATIPAQDPAVRLALLGAGLAPATLLIVWLIAPQGLPVTALVLGAGLALACRAMARIYPHDRLGAANMVTTLRLGLTAALASAVAVPMGQGDWQAWAITGLAVCALSLDGVDGWLARRQTLSSDFGARYDMEVDAALAAVLALILLGRGVAGVELLILGGARYGFVLAARVWPWLGTPLPGSLRRKTVCVIQIGALVALAVPVFPEAMARPVAIPAAILVLWSFAVDIRWLARRA